jgi:hypothetical protein
LAESSQTIQADNETILARLSILPHVFPLSMLRLKLAEDGQVAGSYEHGIDVSSSIECGEFLDQLRDC